MTIYVVMGVLDDIVILGVSRSKAMAEFQRDEINKNGGIGYIHSEVWVKEYELNEDNYVEFE
jgi:hypothetical protein